MTKLKCKCGKRGCSHFGCGDCRLTGEKCVMDVRSYHYACCPINRKLGQLYTESQEQKLWWDQTLRKGVPLR